MKKILDPLAYFPDKKLLLYNSIIFLIGTAIAAWMQVDFSSTIDLHFRAEADEIATLIQNTIIVAILTTILWTAGYTINKKTRLIDALNLAFMIRIPYYLMALINCTGVFSYMASHDVQTIIQKEIPQQATFLAVSSFFMLIFFILVFYLLFKGFKTMTNAKKITHYIALLVSFWAGILLSMFTIHLIE